MSTATRPRAALVVNPRTCGGVPRAVWDGGDGALRSRAELCAILETGADDSNVERIARMIRETTPETVIAAGGDGTVNDVVGAIARAEVAAPPALAIIPLGTGNNAARALGLRSCRAGGQAALEHAVATALAGALRRIDLGDVNGRRFIGSFALGMDADILATYNAHRCRCAALGGYPLYLWSCAVNLLRPHGGPARLAVDGATVAAPVYNLLITNTPLYAGEFRFDADNHADDGWLDLHVFAGPGDYIRCFVAAWIRHLRHRRGRRVQASPGLHRLRDMVIELQAPLRAQIDGEECGATARYGVRVLPKALTVRVPRPA